MTWHKEQLDSWADFNELIESLRFNEQGDAGWYIRGQSDQSWPLQTSLVRNLGEVSIKSALGIELGATMGFKSKYHLHASADGIDKSRWGLIGWWTIMQHYSCPTRLLDWTLSPYVGLYFSVEQFPEIDGALWLFPSSPLETFTEKRYGRLQHESEEQLRQDHIKAIYPIELGFHSLRSASQQAVFTVCTHVLSDHGDVISEAFVGQEYKNPLTKAIIPAGLKNEFLSRLKVMNITPASLFPGLDGLGRASRDYIRLRSWRTLSND